MPSQPACFHRLEEILVLPRGIGHRLTSTVTRHQMATHDVGEWPVEDLPETITLGTGELRIVFDGALDLAARILELSQAMTNDWMTVKRCLEEGPPPSSVRQARPSIATIHGSSCLSLLPQELAPCLPPSRPGEPPATTRVLLACARFFHIEPLKFALETKGLPLGLDRCLQRRCFRRQFPPQLEGNLGQSSVGLGYRSDQVLSFVFGHVRQNGTKLRILPPIDLAVHRHPPYSNLSIQGVGSWHGGVNCILKIPRSN